MTIDINLFGFMRFYFAVLCPWNAMAIVTHGGTSWEYCSLYIGVPESGWLDDHTWRLGWAWNTDLFNLMFGPWKWEKNL